MEKKEVIWASATPAICERDTSGDHFKNVHDGNRRK